MLSTTKSLILVSMRLSKKFLVPPQLALLYEFVNAVDLRQYTEKGVQHETHDELATARQMEEWMRERGLLDAGAHLGAQGHRMAVKLRGALRDYLQVTPEVRSENTHAMAQLNEISRAFPLVVTASEGRVTLAAAPGSGALGRVLGEFHVLATTARLDRLKMCASEECRWVFYDRSKPGNRRWCSSALCGNRHKTRTYRQRQQKTT
jgi:predicted RNA-binding Zn ribbon-like protein